MIVNFKTACKHLLTYLFILSCVFAKGQEDVGKIDEGFLRAIVHIIIPQARGIATGFLVSVKLSDSTESIYLVTNKHVIGDYSLVDPFVPYDSIIVDFYSSITKSTIPIVLQLKDKAGNQSQRISLHPNEKVDIAIINISASYVLHKDIGGGLIDTSFFVRLKNLPKYYLGFGSQVFALGYPANTMIVGSNQAIGKVGYIASSVSGNLKILVPVISRKKDTTKVSPDGSFFLVDGLIIGGNSGGPIVNPKEVKWKIENKAIIYTKKPVGNLILGIVSMALGGTGLTFIYSSDNILDLLNIAIKNNR